MEHRQCEKLIGNLELKLRARGLFMCTAESCTGGMIAAACTSRAGSSEWFKGGIVSYSNEMKMHVLGVPEKVLLANGAVSLPVVEEMARGSLRACEVQAGIAVSGIAGPGGGSAEKPVGTVCIAVAVKPAEDSQPIITSRVELFKGNRREVREQTVLHGLKMLDELIGNMANQ